jgi:hypothetical protein
VSKCHKTSVARIEKEIPGHRCRYNSIGLRHASRPDGTIPASLIHLQSISHESSMMQKQEMKKSRVSSSSLLSNSIKIKENQGDKL